MPQSLPFAIALSWISSWSLPPCAALARTAAAEAPSARAAEASPCAPPRAKKSGDDVADDVNAPRRDARRIELDVTEGTWMNLDVSPDGSTIVFDLLGDIWSMPVTGGQARPLTLGPAWDAQPRFSPDGRRIAFASDRTGMMNAWLMGADGASPRAVTDDDDFYVRGPAWSPDGDYLIARRETGVRGGIPPVELWMWHVEGGDGVKVTDKKEIDDASGPCFSSDGRFLFFSAREEDFSYEPDLSSGLWQVMRLDRRTGETLQLTQGFGGAARPAVSPDGRTLAFLSRRDADTVLVLRSLDSGAERVVRRGLSRDEQEGFGENDLYPGYAFMPDGASLVLWNRGRIERIDVASGDATAIPFRAHVVQWLAPRVVAPERLADDAVRARIIRWPNLSPDGGLLAFDAFGKIWLQRLRDGRPDGPPWRAVADAGAAGARLPQREHAPAISPDGRHVAYVTWSDREGGHLWTVPVADGPAEPVRLTRAAGHYANPAWSPQGDRIAMVRGSGLELRGRQPEEEAWFEATWIPASGGDPQYVTSLQLADSLRFHPQVFFSPDGTRLFHRRPVEPDPDDDESGETAELVSVRLDGTDARAHLALPVLGEVVPSPDGRWVAFTTRDNVYLAPLPDIRLEEPPQVSLEESAVPLWRLSDVAGSFVRFTHDGSALTWSVGRAFHRLALTDVLAFAAKRREEAEGEEAEGDDELKVPESRSFYVEVSLPRDQPAGSLLLRGARVVTMRGDEILARADVLVTGSRIAAVGPSLAAPEGARVVDVAGATIVPGLVDTHAHLHYSGFEVFPDTKWEYAANLAYGVTTVYDPSAPSLDTFAQAEMVEAGLMIGPRVTSSGDVLFGGRQADVWAQVDSLEDAVRQVRRMKAYGARMIKVYQQPRRAQRLWFAEACRREKMPLTAEGAGELMTDLTLALDGYTAWEHALPVELHEDVVQLVARSGTHYTPTLLVAYGGPYGEQWFWQAESPHDDVKLGRFTPHPALDRLGRRRTWISPDEYHFPAAARGIARVLRAGGHVSLGAHGQLQGLGVAWEVRAMAGEGDTTGDRGAYLTPLEALRASTILAADKIGLARDLGSVEPGKKADLLIVDGDPTKDLKALERARWVVKNGRLHDAATLREEWPTRRELPPFFWSGKDR